MKNPLVKSLHVVLDDDLAEKLAKYLDTQLVRPKKTAVARTALRRFLDAPRTAPAWVPNCSRPTTRQGVTGRCGHTAFWVDGVDLMAVCTHCHHWEIGPHEGEPGHDAFAERWRQT